MTDREARPDGRPFFINPTEIRVAIGPSGNVWLSLGKPHSSLGMSPGLVLAAELTPTEARNIADLLARKAREAEGGSSLS